MSSASGEHNWYVEPTRCTTQLIARERFIGSVLDPACGQGNIVRTMTDAGYEAYGQDIVRRVDAETGWFVGTADYLADGALIGHENLVCNPPFYKGAGLEGFIRRALSTTPGKVAIFAPLPFLAGGKRANGLYKELPPDRTWIITPRPSCPPGEYLAEGNKAGGGTEDFVWLVWDMTCPSGANRTSWLTAGDMIEAGA